MRICLAMFRGKDIPYMWLCAFNAQSHTTAFLDYIVLCRIWSHYRGRWRFRSVGSSNRAPVQQQIRRWHLYLPLSWLKSAHLIITRSIFIHFASSHRQSLLRTSSTVWLTRDLQQYIQSCSPWLLSNVVIPFHLMITGFLKLIWENVGATMPISEI